MKKTWKKITSLFLSLLLMLSMVVTPVMAAEAKDAAKDAPSEVKECVHNGFWTDNINLRFEDTAWLNAVNSVTVNGTAYTKGTINSFSSDTNVWGIGTAAGAYDSFKALQIASPSGITYPLTMAITADGYKDLTVKVEKNGYDYTASVVANKQPAEKTYTAEAEASAHGVVALSAVKNLKEGTTVTITLTPDDGYELDTIRVTGENGTAVALEKESETVYTFTMPAENVSVKAAFKEAAPKKIELSGVKIATDYFGNAWEVSFKNAGGYAAAVTGVKVNGTDWEQTAYSPSAGGKYYVNTSDNKLVFAAKDYSTTPVIPVLKSGDVITVSAKGYEDLTMKLVIDTDGKASLTEDDGQGDPYQLFVKIKGTFDSAITGQKNYDTVSGASTGGANSNKNSDVTVYGALVKKGEEPKASDWEELDNLSKINLNGKKCSVSIIPDTANGTSADCDSGMQGVYMTISSGVTLSGIPKDAGNYLVSVSIEDMQGRTAVSNTLPFHVYTGEETLAEELVTENLKHYAGGKYAWNIMEPWAIKNFGSNVEGEKESVRVPKELAAWFGSKSSGLYGYLGYDLAWKEVEKGTIPQTLYIPDGCDLTLTNMKVLSSVRIVVEKGGKLTLNDSVVQGMIDVKAGGTFSMNYDAFNEEFTTGASICGQLRLEDGAVLENAAIYSHANYLANGNLTDRTTSEPVVTATGNVTIKGNVYIAGDDAGSEIGQTALRVSNGTLHLEDDAQLVAYGGSGKTLLYTDGGTAIELDDAVIEGNGQVTAIGGDVLWGNGGNAVSGNGVITANAAFLQGATASSSRHAAPGQAIDGTVYVTGPNRHMANGTVIDNGDDPLASLYWKTGIDAEAPLDQFVTEKVTKGISVADIENQTYTGKELTPVVKVTDKDDETKVLEEGKDYFIRYEAPAERAAGNGFSAAGTYDVTVTGIGDYYGTVAKTFTIEPKQDDSNNNGSDKNNGSDNGNNNGSNDNTLDNNGTDSGLNNSFGNNANSNGANAGSGNHGTGSSGNNVSNNGSNAGMITSGTTNADQTVNGTQTSDAATNTAAASAVPKTADSNGMILWFVMIALAGGAWTTIVCANRRRQ